MLLFCVLSSYDYEVCFRSNFYEFYSLVSILESAVMGTKITSAYFQTANLYPLAHLLLTRSIGVKSCTIKAMFIYITEYHIIAY